MTDTYSLAELRRIARGETTRAEVDRARSGRSLAPRLGGTIPRAAVLDYAEGPEAAREFDPIARLEGMSLDDISRLQAEEMATGAADRARREYSPLPGGDNWGPVDALAGLVTDRVGRAVDAPLARLGDSGARDRNAERERIDRDVGRGIDRNLSDAVLDDEGVDWEGAGETIDATGEALTRDLGGTALEFWRGLSGRGDRGDAVYAGVMRDYERDARREENRRLGGGGESFSYDPGAMDAADARDFRGSVERESDLTRGIEDARAAEAFDNVSGAAELIPGVGLIDAPVGLARGGARLGARALGRSAPRWAERVSDRLGRLGGVEFSPDEAARLDRGPVDDALDRPLTREARDARNWGLASGIGAGVTGAALAEASAEDDGQDSELERARAEIERLEGIRDQIQSVDLNDADAVRNVQRLVGTSPDGRWQTNTTAAVEQYMGQLRADLESARGREQEAIVADRYRETETPGWVEAAREFGPYVGAGTGLALGYATRRGAVNQAARKLTARNAELDALVDVSEPMRGTSVRAVRDRERRASDLNDFWREGGAGESVPYQTAGTGAGYRRRRRPAEVSSLFPEGAPRRIRSLGDLGAEVGDRFRSNDLAMIGTAGAEAVGSTLWLQQIEEDLRNAEEAAQSNPTTANLRRVESLRDQRSLVQSVRNAGAAFASARLGASLKAPYPRGRPDLSRAESARMALDRHLAPRPRRRPRRLGNQTDTAAPLAPEPTPTPEIAPPQPASTGVRASFSDLSSEGAQMNRLGKAADVVDFVQQQIGGSYATGREAIRALRAAMAADPALASRINELAPALFAVAIGGAALSSIGDAEAADGDVGSSFDPLDGVPDPANLRRLDRR